MAVMFATLWAANAHAAKPAPAIQPVSPAQLRTAGGGQAARLRPGCVPGTTGPGVFAVNYLLPPNDAYYTFLHCDACAPELGQILEVHVALYFPVACDQPVEISFVGVQGDPLCLEPDTLNVLAVPAVFHLVAPIAGDYDFSLTLPTLAQVGTDAFLCVKFAVDGGPECSTLLTRPQLLTSGSCQRCQIWNDSVAGRWDLCHLLFPGQPVMYAVLESCAVPVRPRSWGSLKLLYR